MIPHKKLKEVLKRDDTVLFIGSGVSLWSGLPTWKQLIEELATFVEGYGHNGDEIRKEALQGDLLQAASYGFDKLTKPQIGYFIQKACRSDTALPHDIHQKIVNLGPSCFITTNYDNLIEDSLRKWQSNQKFKTVTNRQLTEMAGIVGAREFNFVFKPHGDVNDSESIILTREQYRQLLPNGEWHAALDSLKTILMTRPVVYIGFGLRDLDFIYVRDLLENIYKGGVRDHYAIMADVSASQIDFWRKNYGIHLASYDTQESDNSSKKHFALLKLLDDLMVEDIPASTQPPSAPISTTDAILPLMRHAEKVIRTQKEDSEFPIRVVFENRGSQKGSRNFSRMEFDHCYVDKFLDNGPSRTILIGPPGAGKSYSINRAAARLAETLRKHCLAEPFDENAIVIPLVIDLKLYQGDLYKQAAESLPSGLILDDLLQRFKVKIFLDSFNEMPREFRENTSYEADFSTFIAQIGNAAIIIGSRTSDGLDKFGFPTYLLDHIDKKFIESELERLKLSVHGRFEQEILSLLQKPFYFHLVATRTVILPSDPHPRDFYQTLFIDLTDLFEKRFRVHFNLTQALSIAAYEAIDIGEEAYPLELFLQSLKNQLHVDGITTVEDTDIANWLASKSIIIPYTGARVAFFHQSVTEFLAACELSRRYQNNPQVLTETLSHTRWDQALLLTLSLLPPDAGTAFLQTIIDTDFKLALNASKYLETGRDEMIAKLLSELSKRLQNGYWDVEYTWRIGNIIESKLPISKVHEPQLRALLKSDTSIGRGAAEKLGTFKRLAIKDELMPLMLNLYTKEPNYCINIATALAPLATIDDIQTISNLADLIEQRDTVNSNADISQHFVSMASTFLTKFNLFEVCRVFLPKDEAEKIPAIRAEVLMRLITLNQTSSTLDLAGMLLLRGVKNVAYKIYFWGKYSSIEDNLKWDSFNQDHVQALLSQIISKGNNYFSGRALFFLCRARSDLAKYVNVEASKENGINKAVMLYFADNDPEPIFSTLSQLVSMSVSELSQQTTEILRTIEINWTGHECLLVQLLQLKDTELAVSLINTISIIDENLRELDISPIDWWLQWLMDEKPETQRHEFHNSLGRLLARHTSDETFSQIIDEFNQNTSKFRRVILDYIFDYRFDLNLERFSEDALSYLIKDLNQAIYTPSPFTRHLLAKIATEQFVRERLLPLLPDAKPPLLNNLRKVLWEAGARHGRRYIAD